MEYYHFLLMRNSPIKNWIIYAFVKEDPKKRKESALHAHIRSINASALCKPINGQKIDLKSQRLGVNEKYVKRVRKGAVGDHCIMLIECIVERYCCSTQREELCEKNA